MKSSFKSLLWNQNVYKALKERYVCQTNNKPCLSTRDAIFDDANKIELEAEFSMSGKYEPEDFMLLFLIENGECLEGLLSETANQAALCIVPTSANEEYLTIVALTRK